MAVHTLSKFVANAWTGLAVVGSYTADLGILNRCIDAENGDYVRITNGNAGGGDAVVFIVGVGSNKGVIRIATGNVTDTHCIMVGDGVHVPDIYELVVKHAGTIALADAARATAVITAGDGVHAPIAFVCGAGAGEWAPGATAIASLTNLSVLMVAAKAAGLFDVTVSGVGTATLTLTNDHYTATPFTTTITVEVTHFTVTDPTTGTAVTGTHFGVGRQATALLTATELAAEINAHAVCDYAAGTPYADPLVATTICIPLTSTSKEGGSFIMDTFATNVTVTEGAEEYQRNSIGLQEVTGSYAAGWTPVAALAQKVTMTSIAGGGAGTGIFKIAKGLCGLCIPGGINADIIVLPHLLATATVIGAFTAATDKVVATGIVRNH